MDLLNISRMIDVSAVRTNVPVSEVERLALAARTYRFICAFVMPCYTRELAALLKDAPQVKIGGVVGFPSGAVTTPIKLAEAKEQLANGADELDMVINVGALQSGRDEFVYRDIRTVVEAAEGKPVKSILETAYLTDEEIARACRIAVRAGVAYVKTGTGWAGKPATPDTIRLMRDAVEGRARIKAAGGIRTLDVLLALEEAGCSRFGIGVGSAVSILREAWSRAGKTLPELPEGEKG